ARQPPPHSPRWHSTLKRSYNMHPVVSTTLSDSYHVNGQKSASTQAHPRFHAPGVPPKWGRTRPEYGCRFPANIESAHSVLQVAGAGAHRAFRNPPIPRAETPAPGEASTYR